MVCGSDVPAVVIASNPLVQVGLTSILSRIGFRIIRTDTAAEGSADPTSSELYPSLILAAPEDSRSVEALRTLRATCPEAKLVLLGQGTGPAALPQDLCLAAQALLDSGIGREALINVLHVVMSGATVQSRRLYDIVFRRPTTALDVLADQKPIHFRAVITDGYIEQVVGLAHKLTQREVEVLRCLAEGASNKMIAHKFTLAEATVKVHVKAVLRKLKLDNRTQAAMWATEHGIMPEGSA
ncbi:helix-turn-helix transcriptional regulator [Methylobacterium nigriterrae]|uniref:helix-turn-helix transcriptional regulator n=1 Tax=Methylobacterium nigriterrae TaxID=3127512 RepID=UPI003013937C